jgi:DNA-binding transcriptional regulator YhcF (GntR family)
VACVDRTSGQPVYRQVADALREMIRSGELAGDQSLPSETDLIRRYGVSRNSVRTAVGLLRLEGLIVTEHGRGSFVRTRRSLRRLGSSRSSKANEGEDWRLLGVEVADPPEQVASRLGLASGELVLVRRYLLLVGGEPTQLVDRYFPLRVANGSRHGQAESSQTAWMSRWSVWLRSWACACPARKKPAGLGSVVVCRSWRWCAPVMAARGVWWRSPSWCWSGIDMCSPTSSQPISWLE